jgi:hypothetical protein
MIQCGSVFVWRESAACQDSELDWFADEHNDKVIRELVAVCEGCRVAAECLSDAMRMETDANSTWGVRAGLKASERYALRRLRVPA